ncbi:MAG: FadR family transcriptional regulator [Pseudomonadaceae bacterium]|nr:FadR family transcriptional regulator [Pseudomonadaceae bacterium]
MHIDAQALPALPGRIRRSSHIAEILQTMIGDGRLKAGDRLPTEAALCAKFGVSRTTLREAIQMLRSNGLLDVSPGRGSYVRLPDMNTCMENMMLAAKAYVGNGLAHALHLRASLAGPLLEQALQAPQSKRQEVARHMLTRDATAADNAAAEEQWHTAIAELAGNPLQTLLVKSLLCLERPQRTRYFGNIDNVMRTMHLQMRVNSAVIDGDAAMAERLLTGFLREGYADALPRAVGM